MMYQTLLSFSLFLVVTGEPRDVDVHLFDQLAAIDDVWSEYKTQYVKEYTSDTEESERKKIFTENLKEIEMHNYLHSLGLKSYEMGVNEFTDWTFAEFLEHKSGSRLNPSHSSDSGATYLSPATNFTLPESMDWLAKGCVTPVKNQQSCGSCWSFTSTGSLEGQWCRKTGTLVSLSEQNLIDCSTQYGNHGCNGGWMSNAFDYIKDNGGIDTEECYPYEARQGPCRYNPDCKGATLSGYVNIPESESKLTEALATIGPISVAIYAGPSLMKYKSGVYDDPDCNHPINHGVLAVGYGTENGKDFYIVKNSWGTTWGEDGHVRMSRNKQNQCSIASHGIYPTV